MKRINVLDENTSNKIAAGEVVEGPFSVVKELIENSIDAKSKNITIEIYEGGEKSIRVTDDGEGIHPDDIKMAFMTHATSKINKLEDVFNISSMGFRGEALPSIASVSNTIFKSRIKENDFGKEISISGGNIDYIKDTGCNVGTSITVNNLFYNVPARKKFMKSTQREAALITNIVSRLALANSDISFKLINNGKNSVTSYGTDNILDTIRFVYDKKTCENIISFQEHFDILSIHGCLGTEELSRGSRNNQSIFVNNRYIKSKLITAAVETAYKSFLMVNKFPFFIVFIDIYPEEIDINVHPTKSEIKFKDERFIFKSVFEAVHNALKNSRINSFMVKEQTAYNTLEKQEEKQEVKEEVKEEIKFVDIPIDFTNKTVANSFLVKENHIERKLPFLKIIGQFNNTYIIAEAKDEMFIIDQHAAHEKILFERFREEIKNKQVACQLLIIPEVIELSEEDYITYIENKEIFSSTGFNIEIFGENTITIREVPIVIGKPDIKDLFSLILENLNKMGTGETIEVKYNKIASISCKAAIKANRCLSNMEMERLIEDLAYIEDPFNCPHGRPTIIKISLNEMEKKFKRIK